MARRGRNRVLRNDLQCVGQFASGILCGRLGRIIPRLSTESPLGSGSRGLCTRSQPRFSTCV